ncbi:hypothetical protein D3C86_1142270 [compost metagenome]
MDDPGARRHHLEIGQALLCPLDELITFGVPAVIDVEVLLDGIRLGVALDNHRVIDDQHRRNHRVHGFRCATHFSNHVTHAGKVSQRRQTRCIVKHQPIGIKRHFASGGVLAYTRDDIVQSRRGATSHILQQDTDRIGQTE